jgi:hypothetical protein
METVRPERVTYPPCSAIRTVSLAIPFSDMASTPLSLWPPMGSPEAKCNMNTNIGAAT